MYKQIVDFKRKWNINKIVGLMMLHYFKWPWCLEELTHYVDEIYILLHYSPSFRAEWPKNVPKVKDFIEINVDVEWEVMEWRKHQGNFRESLLRRLDDVRPEVVFFPDEDESFPEPDYLIKDLDRLIASKKGQLAFKRCNFWDSRDMVRKDKWVTYYPHVKIFKWQPELTYVPYIGFNRLTSYGQKEMVAKAALKHYAYMNREERERRYYELYKNKEKTFKGLLEKPKLVRYTNPFNVPRT